MMSRKLIALIWICTVSVFLIQCTTRTDSSRSISYYGEYPPADTATVFALGSVSTNHHEHSRIQFSINGQEMFWAVIPVDTTHRSASGRPFRGDEQTIWQTKYIDGEWTKPKRFHPTQSIGGSSPALSPNGNYLYYRTRKPDADPNIRPRPSQLWKATRKDGIWANPIPEDALIQKPQGRTFMSFCFARNGNLYFDFGGPDETGEWSWNIYLSKYKDGEYAPPIKMGSGINESQTSWCPWIAPDESYIIYSSHRDGEMGHGDLYIHFKDEQGSWTSPINMGPRVNSEKQERFPSVSPDGKILFFARHMPETFSDFFWIDASIIGEIKKKVFE